MDTITTGERVLEELFADFTKQLVAAWTRRHVDDLAAEVLGGIGHEPAPLELTWRGPR